MYEGETGGGKHRRRRILTIQELGDSEPGIFRENICYLYCRSSGKSVPGLTNEKDKRRRLCGETLGRLGCGSGGIDEGDNARSSEWAGLKGLSFGGFALRRIRNPVVKKVAGWWPKPGALVVQIEDGVEVWPEERPEGAESRNRRAKKSNEAWRSCPLPMRPDEAFVLRWPTCDENPKEKDMAERIEVVTFFSTNHDYEQYSHPGHFERLQVPFHRTHLYIFPLRFPPWSLAHLHPHSGVRNPDYPRTLPVYLLTKGNGWNVQLSTNTTSKLLRRAHTIKAYDRFFRSTSVYISEYPSPESLHEDVVTIENPISNSITTAETTSVPALPRKDLARSFLISRLVEGRRRFFPRLWRSDMAWSCWVGTASRARYV
ncbi:hypothetical protein IW261DRAFT_1592534 [Armillaria novae-zelandiae]|uniref:Uncharacterized protein n=1 Tax=Armillaria novae-zelandiae TaxID=153914 RepID=A0AA39PCH7_9AGAR|nr:hypothetical protein IW261DRAFT_1592534 [Armillaria novae-zelandiae]